MIRLAPEAPHDAAEEKKKIREIIVSNVTTFFVAVAVIKLSEYSKIELYYVDPTRHNYNAVHFSHFSSIRDQTV